MPKIILAHIIFKAASALRFGGGEFSLLQDSPVMRDFNALPVILGSSIAGVLRHKFAAKFGEKEAKIYFGEGENSSKFIFSNALILDENFKVCEELKTPNDLGEFLQIFSKLPQRQHNKINHQGVVEKGAKFDEEVIFSGTRFKFSIEMNFNDESEKEAFFALLKLLVSPEFRLGAGSSKGFGKIEILEIRYEIFALNEADKISSSLNENLSQIYDLKEQIKEQIYGNFTRYILKISPEKSYIFGAGYGDKNADNIGVREKIVDYEKACLSEKKILIPASSIKGALAHRTLFYINENLGNFVGENDENLDKKAAQIHALIFGNAKDKDTKSGKKGRILMSDIFAECGKDEVFAHNSIDRFSGGVKDGALFQEKADLGGEFECEILIENDQNSDDFNAALNAFESALNDVCAGLLPLGAASSKGHGFFGGEVFKNGEKLAKKEARK